jgi:hypothetical protein
LKELGRANEDDEFDVVRVNRRGGDFLQVGKKITTGREVRKLIFGTF